LKASRRVTREASGNLKDLTAECVFDKYSMVWRVTTLAAYLEESLKAATSR
jgi:hypothetical protein